MEDNTDKCYEILNKNNIMNDDIFMNTFKYPFDNIYSFLEITQKSPMLWDVNNNIIQKLNSDNFFSYVTKIYYFDGYIYDHGVCPGDNDWYLVCELMVDELIFYCYYYSHCCYTGFEACGWHKFYFSTDLKNLVCYGLQNNVRTNIINAFDK